MLDNDPASNVDSERDREQQIKNLRNSVRRDLEKNRRELENLQAELSGHRRQKDALLQSHRNHLRQLKADRSHRDKILDRLRNQKTLELAAIEALQKSAKQFDRKIRSLNQKLDGAAGERIDSKKHISRYKGLLNMPVKGKIKNCC